MRSKNACSCSVVPASSDVGGYLGVEIEDDGKVHKARNVPIIVLDDRVALVADKFVVGFDFHYLVLCANEDEDELLGMNSDKEGFC